MELPVEARVGAEALLEAGALGGQQVQPRDLVLVLVGHQLEQVAGDRVGDRRAAAAAAPLGLAHVDEEVDVLGRVGEALVVGELGDADPQQALELLVAGEALDQRLLLGAQVTSRGRIRPRRHHLCDQVR